ncbi:MAG: AraC family ligand binding domain-containing protein [Burkholderiales bacterium]|nr:AraC family ligand binding domain-containing protein [Burkholderiales bacterium]
MAIPHAVSGDLVKVHPAAESLPGMFSTAIVKGAHLEVIRVVLPAGKAFPEHRVAGEVTVQCIKGVFEFRAHGRTQTLADGDMLFLAAHEPHELLAIQDAAAIVTISLNGTSA